MGEGNEGQRGKAEEWKDNLLKHTFSKTAQGYISINQNYNKDCIREIYSVQTVSDAVLCMSYYSTGFCLLITVYPLQAQST